MANLPKGSGCTVLFHAIDEPISLFWLLSRSRECAREGAVSAKEELLQGRSEHVVSRAVVLTFQGTQLRMRYRLAQRSRRLIHKRIARATVHDQGRHEDVRRSFDGHRPVFAQDSSVVIGKRRRDRLKLWPCRGLTHSFNLLGWHPNILHKQRHGIASAIGCSSFSQL